MGEYERRSIIKHEHFHEGQHLQTEYFKGTLALFITNQ